MAKSKPKKFVAKAQDESKPNLWWAVRLAKPLSSHSDEVWETTTCAPEFITESMGGIPVVERRGPHPTQLDAIAAIVKSTRAHDQAPGSAPVAVPDQAGSNSLVCPRCSRQLSSKSGYTLHLKSCQPS